MRANTYTTINHVLLKKMGVSVNEYVILDIIYHLSDTNEWCHASKQYIADCFGISKSACEKIIYSLIERGFIVKRDSDIKFLQVTDKFLIERNDVVKNTTDVANFTSDVVKNTTDVVKSANNNNIYNNNINIIYNILYKINPVINSMRGYKSQREACIALLKQEPNVIDILTWYATEYGKIPRDQFLPLATIPTKIVEKWVQIKEYYLSKQKNAPLTVDSIDAIIDKYNK